MSTGAWIFATVVAVAIVAPVGVYAAASSVVAVGNASGNATALVTPTRQLQTAITSPANVVHAVATLPAGSCTPVYTPPTGKGIDVTQLTYDLGSATQGTESWVAVSTSGCPATYDLGDTVQAFEAQSHTFPTGLPMASVSAYNGTASTVYITLTGYLIPSAQVPPSAATPSSGRALKVTPSKG
jgi:hypothetical protein